MNSTSEKSESNKSGLIFIRDVAKYFMDFLETDFHKRKNPKRSIKLRDSDNLLIGINLNKYSSFNTNIWKLINHNFTKNNVDTLEKGVYKTSIPKNLVDLIKLQAEKIDKKQINDAIKTISDEIEKASILYKKEYDKALNASLEESSKIIKQDLVLPFISHIEKPLENLQLGDENNIYLMEEEMTAVLLRLIENKVSEILNLLIVDNKVNIEKELKSAFDFDDIKNNIINYFENIQVADLFSEVFEMERNRSILDKQEFYLYFTDITFDKIKYPIFYIPFSLKKDNDIFRIEFDSQIYINKKALEFAVQEYNKNKDLHGNLKSITERIIYLSQHETDLVEILNSILKEIINFFELDSAIDITNSEPLQVARSLLARVSNSTYISLFDKSDEALVNDYEEIVTLLSSEDSILGDAFNKLIDNFIYKNPEPFNPQVEDEWDNLDNKEKLVSEHPIPLNSEQLQIVSAIKKDGCKYLTVEGPPGTGKSHTITAIIFDAILKNKSVLVLSDKKEALDVVEDKITETINKVRHDKDFQNPILRLGKTGSTYGQILAKASIEKIKTHHRAIKKDYDNLQQNISKLSNSVKEDLEAEVLAYKDIDIHEIQEFSELEKYFIDNNPLVDVQEVTQVTDSGFELEELRKIILDIRKNVQKDSSLKNKIFNFINISEKEFCSLADFKSFISYLELIESNIQAVKDTYKDKISTLKQFKQFTIKDLEYVKTYIQSVENLKGKIFGYMFRKEKLQKLDVEFKNNVPSSLFETPHEHIGELRDVYELLYFASSLNKDIKNDWLDVTDYYRFIHCLLADENYGEYFKNLIKLSDEVTYFESIISSYPLTAQKTAISVSDFSTVINNKFSEVNDLEFNQQIRYINLIQKLNNDFNKIPSINYAGQKKNIEDLVTAQVTYMLDGRLIDFYENNKADAETLRNIIKNKQRFPKEEFSKIKEAFPCILAGIRDYAEYIPLQPDIFDLVIIDEASQVSIAQAFPALLRAKKVLILGDKKQFSNIKAAQARSDTNKEYLNRLEDSFKTHVSVDASKLVKLGKFDIKTSILEFFEFISNYNIQLLKHFRGYKEIISYSNKYFYQESLQVMKIRGKAVDEVIKFSFIDNTDIVRPAPNSNENEVDFIISELQKIKESNKTPTVGIITPHTNQQKILVDKINRLADRDYYFDKLNLKIMTFDTCQGEERDIIYYSMVADKDSDRLWGIFIKDLTKVDIEEDGQIKAQRLNVGLSRAKECMHFVLSKPIDDFNGSIGDALRHYQFVLDEAKKEKDISQTDQKSKMEPEVMNWFYQTEFWNKNKDRIDFIPQFEIGKYLRQLDRNYTHPNYKVDFLLVYKDEAEKTHKIVIEYDGFVEHFSNLDEVNEFNYDHYYSDDDLYREKVIESYGYKFLRINRFNIGTNPMATLDERIGKIIKGRRLENQILTSIHETVDGLENGEMKECPKCKEIRNLSDFKDSSLITGHGRFCQNCKNIHKDRVITKSVPVVDNSKKCPKCSSGMILRNGRRGKFYGCSKFPYCRGTREV